MLCLRVLCWPGAFLLFAFGRSPPFESSRLTETFWGSGKAGACAARRQAHRRTASARPAAAGCARRDAVARVPVRLPRPGLQPGQPAPAVQIQYVPPQTQASARCWPRHIRKIDAGWGRATRWQLPRGTAQGERRHQAKFLGARPRLAGVAACPPGADRRLALGQAAAAAVSSLTRAVRHTLCREGTACCERWCHHVCHPPPAQCPALPPAPRRCTHRDTAYAVDRVHSFKRASQELTRCGRRGASCCAGLGIAPQVVGFYPV